MTALNGIFELSSILKTEDLEKCDLSRKKIATQQAINQQECRLSRETEEQSRIVGDVSTMAEKLDDVVALMEMMELTVSELNNHSRESCGQMVAEMAEAWLVRTNDALGRADFAKSMIAKAESMQTDRNLNLLQNHLTFDSVANALENSKKSRSQMRNAKAACLELKEKKEGELASVDDRTADSSDAEEKLREKMSNNNADIDAMQQTCVHERSALQITEQRSGQEKFQASALLGRKTEEMLTLKQSISTELRSTEATNAQLSAVEKQLRAFTQEDAKLAAEQDAVDRSSTSVREQITSGTRARTELSASLTSLQTELESTNLLLQNTLQQSFRARADSLAEDVAQARIGTAAKRAQLAAVEDMITGRCAYSEMDTRAEQLAAVQAEEDALAAEHTALTSRSAQVALEAALEHSTLQEVVQEGSVLHDSSVSADRATQQQALEEHVKELQAAVEANPALEISAEQRAQQAQRTQEAAAAGAQLKRAAEERSALLEARTAERTILEQKVTEKNQVALTKHTAAQKQARLNAVLTARQNANRQSLSRLRKMLLDDDRVFQEAQQKLSAEFNTAMGALEQELVVVKRKIADAAADTCSSAEMQAPCGANAYAAASTAATAAPVAGAHAHAGAGLTALSAVSADPAAVAVAGTHPIAQDPSAPAAAVQPAAEVGPETTSRAAKKKSTKQQQGAKAAAAASKGHKQKKKKNE